MFGSALLKADAPTVPGCCHSHVHPPKPAHTTPFASFGSQSEAQNLSPGGQPFLDVHHSKKSPPHPPPSASSSCPASAVCIRLQEPLNLKQLLSSPMYSPLPLQLAVGKRFFLAPPFLHPLPPPPAPSADPSSEMSPDCMPHSNVKKDLYRICAFPFPA